MARNPTKQETWKHARLIKEQMRIPNIVTADMSRVFFRGSLAVMNRSGFETALCSSLGERLNEVAAAEDAQITNTKAACQY